MDNLEERAAPISERLLIQMEKNGVLLEKICEYKQAQKDNDFTFREKWQQEKCKGRRNRRNSRIFTVAQIVIGLTMLGLGLIDVNKDHPVIVYLTGLMKTLAGYL
ncbi:MAG: hypothetical protein V3R25_05970 [Nitrosomonadaceae bacterium]